MIVYGIKPRPRDGQRSSHNNTVLPFLPVRFSQFKELWETLKFIMYPDVISFYKLNLPLFDGLEIEEFDI
ncbi:hypothetical protein TNCV_997241 [Trichonephila clavipes]|uniref:Uncharacterized protein n=1 Tax=Trichonephila clavipes TaxID=2585209 RepID=A0A8X6WFE6_TRICX|nr:hypothetical protein TNCV_997241 [Trichonephila clavipes]